MNFTVDNIARWIETYHTIGVVIALFLPLIEAFLPMIPLIAIATGNAVAFGLWQGFLFTWIGASAGAILVFWLIRKISGTRIHRYMLRHKSIVRASNWFELHGFSVLFILRCFPFTPSSLINVLAGLSKMPYHTYIAATVLGKAVMVLMISVLGADLPGLLREPWKLVLAILLILGMWIIGKRLECHYLKKS